MAKGSLTYNKRLIVNGSVYLILADDCEVVAKKGIDATKEDSTGGGGGNTGTVVPRTFAIYAQSEDEHMGRMEADMSDDIKNDACIGGTQNKTGCPVTIHGGRVTASTIGDGAAIGGGAGGWGTVTVYGGMVDAISEREGAGLGSGYYGEGTVTIYGGSVTANGYESGAGIGGGNGGTGTVTIYGGNVTASAGWAGTGIGGGENGTGTVTIYGGSVNATVNKSSGAGIGGGTNGAGTVTIYGGSVNATANESGGAGIGGGLNGTGTVIIHGGSVTASASGDGAAIGGGCLNFGSLSCSVTIKGGNVKARTSGNSAAIGGGNVVDYSSDEDEDASLDCDVTIEGGCVTASAIGDGESESDGILNCEVSLGLTKATEYVYAQSYRANNDTLTLTEPLRILGGDGEYTGQTEAGAFAGRVVIPASSNDTLFIFPDNADFTLPSDLTEVEASAFENVTAVAVVVPESVTAVGERAFSGGVKKIRFLGEHTIVDASAFADCESVTAFAIPGTDTWKSLGAIPGIILMPIT